MNKFEILGELPERDSETQTGQRVLKNGISRSALCRVATDLQFVKNIVPVVYKKQVTITQRCQYWF